MERGHISSACRAKPKSVWPSGIIHASYGCTQSARTNTIVQTDTQWCARTHKKRLDATTAHHSSKHWIQKDSDDLKLCKYSPTRHWGDRQRRRWTRGTIFNQTLRSDCSLVPESSEIHMLIHKQTKSMKVQHRYTSFYSGSWGASVSLVCSEWSGCWTIWNTPWSIVESNCFVQSGIRPKVAKSV